MNRPLSGNDLLIMYRRMGGVGTPNLFSYSDLGAGQGRHRTLDQIIGPYGAIILFKNSRNMGHWCALYRNSKGIFFFDSYGCIPDTQHQFIPKHMAVELNGTVDQLTKLLYRASVSGKTIHYNQHPLQNFHDPKISTCGRWCVLRLLHPNMSVDSFYRVMTKAAKDAKISTDQLVTLITS